MKLFSIITVVLNNKDGLEQTIKSVINQTFKDFEYIIIDGGSTDGTIDVIKKYEEYIDLWISEKDKGIFEGMNKGILYSKGDYLIFLNSGDFFVSNSILDFVKNNLLNNGYDLLVGNSLYINKSMDVVFVHKSRELTSKAMLGGTVSHQATFIRRSIFDKIGIYDEQYSIAADTEWFLRYVHSKGFEKEYILVDKNISYCEYGGLSTSGNLRTSKEALVIRSMYYNGFDKLSIIFKHYMYITLFYLGVVKLKRWLWKKFNWK